MLSVALIVVLCVTASLAQNLSLPEFEPELAQRDQFSPESYKFTFPTDAVNSAAGSIKNMDLSSNPFLGTLPNGGLAQYVDTFAACTINVPHSHPRGNEIYYVIDGVLEAGIQEEAGGRFVQANLTSQENVVVPQGLLHYVYNPSCSQTQLLQIWDNADFGTVIAYAEMVTNFPEDVLMAFTGLDVDTIAKLKAAVPPVGPINQSKACLAKCGLAPSTTPSAGRRLH